MVLTAAALLGFAGNSLLCRRALAEHRIDATVFTVVRLASGALVLALVRLGHGMKTRRGGNWASGAALFLYAAPFSFAYLRIGAGLGALVLFASVQITMISWALLRGERPTAGTWVGILIAVGGLIALTVPGKSAPDLTGTTMMAFAGFMWGVYSLRGRGAAEGPLAATAGNFIRSLPLAGGLAVAGLLNALSSTPPTMPTVTLKGVALAVGSGSIASGLGYSLWYAALPGLTATNAAVVQLLVPLVATAGGIWLLGEQLVPRVAISGLAILVGVATVISCRQRQP
jgi:drug/metabolite transporter (DMT)-like permease